MLVLTSKESDEILLGEIGFEVGEHIIKIRVIKIGNNKARIGIEAPEGIEILRSKLLEERSNANRISDAETDVPARIS